MKLKSEYFKQIRDALMGAFNPASMQSMVRIELERNLDEIVPQKGTFREQVETLMRWAEEQDRVEDLVAGARRENPTNKNLETAEEQLLSADKDAYIQSDDAALTTNDTAADTYTDARTGLEMVRIPAGEFIYGEEDRLEYLPEFWISKTPVTNALYLRFVRETDHDSPKHWKGKSPKAEIADHPVIYVSCYDAEAYADWFDMRLPTEEEWEKAARGTDGRIYPWGNEWRDGYCNTWETDTREATPTGQFSPQGDSPFGCVDMAGNVWEWTASRFDDEEKYRVVRGGSWLSDPNDSRSSFRAYDRPGGRYYCFDFRLVVFRPPS